MADKRKTFTEDWADNTYTGRAVKAATTAVFGSSRKKGDDSIEPKGPRSDNQRSAGGKGDKGGVGLVDIQEKYRKKAPRK